MRDRPAYNAYMAAYMLRRYHRVRAGIVASLGGTCAKCAANDNLEIDHEDASLKSFNIAKLWSMKPDRLALELAKCQLLCSPCHAAKSITDRGHQPTTGRHGTVSTYRNCKCELCKDAKRDYMRARKQRIAANDNA